MKTYIFDVTFVDEMLGTSSADPDIYRKFIASKAPEPDAAEGEADDLGDDAAERGMTVFMHDEDGTPYVRAYQWKGFFKDSAKMNKKVRGSASAARKAYRQEIDGELFVAPDKIRMIVPKGKQVGRCERPLRASTAQGDRVALASSESVPAGTVLRFGVTLKLDDMEDALFEWMEDGVLRGFGQWRNSGRGRFLYAQVEKDRKTGEWRKVDGNWQDWPHAPGFVDITRHAPGLDVLDEPLDADMYA